MGTDNGLSLFDGYHFKQYISSAGDSLSLIHDHVLCFFISGKASLFIGTHNGICEYDRRTDRFKQYRRGYLDGHIRGFYEEGGQVYAVNDRSQIFKVMENSLQLVADFDQHNYSYLRDEHGNHWFGMDGGVLFINAASGERKFYELKSIRSGVDPTVAVFAMQNDEDRIWLGTRSDGVFYLDKASNTLSAFHFRLHFIKAFDLDQEGNLLIGDTEGLKIYLRKKNKLLDYKPLVEKSEQHITENAIDALYRDRQGNLWLGIKFRGLNLAYLDKGFRHIDYQSHDPFDKTKKTVTSILVDSDEEMWLGAYTNGLEHVNLRSHRSEYIACNRNPGGLQCGTVYELYRDRDSVIWLGSYNGGLQRMHPKSGQIETWYPGRKTGNPMNVNDIRSIAEDIHGNFWMVAHGNGVYKWNPETDSLRAFRNDPDNPRSLVNDWAFHLICDSQGFVWVGTPFGLSVSRDGRSFDRYQHDTGDPKSLISNEVFTIFEDARKQIWVGTREGLCKYNPVEDNFSVVSKKQGLADNYICSILEDDHKNLWIGTKKGLSKYNTLNGNIDNFSKGDGLQDDEFMENAAAKTPSGYLIFGSVNRGIWFHPDSLMVNEAAPEVYLTDFKIFYKSVPIEPGKKDAILTKSIRYTREVVLNHNQKVISISFVALNYIHPEKNKFAYKLEGFDNDWIYPQNNQEVTYTNLTPGDYVFRVKAANNDGKWNSKGTSLKIKVLPPFWETWWFRTLAGLFASGILLLLFFLRIRRIKQSNITLEQTVKERTHELQLKNEILARKTEELNHSNALLAQRQEKIIRQSEQLQEKNEQLSSNAKVLSDQKEKLEQINLQLSELNTMKDKFFSVIGHDLRNPINVIKGFVDLIEEGFNELKEEDMRFYLSHISSAVTKTSKLLDNLLNWARSQSGSMQINPEDINMHSLIRDTVSFFRDEADKKNIAFRTEPDSRLIFANADRNMVDTIIRNLISNAVKFSPGDSTITVGCGPSDEAGKILIWVRDQGVGIAPQQKEKLFHAESNFSTAGTAGETGTGLGLILCREFVEKSRGRIWVESEPSRGSVFYFTLPVGQG